MRLSIQFIFTIVLIGGALSLALAGTSSVQSSPSIGVGGQVDTATGAQEPAPPEETGAIQERGILPGHLAPGHVMPGAVLQFTAPTPSLAAIRNALKVTAKSISVNLRIPPNLPVTVPIEVSVAYLSPVHTQRLTKVYSPASGLTLLYREAEGDGKPRTMGMDITVRELIPNGQSFSISKQLTIVPLYRASISPLKFQMATQCDTVGKSDITFHWIYFDGKHREQKFDLGLGETKIINYFNSIRREFSTEDNLKEPVMQFFERDLGHQYFNPIDQPVIPLAPGPTKEFKFMLKGGKTGPPGSPFGTSGCRANISYRIDRSLMTFDQF